MSDLTPLMSQLRTLRRRRRFLRTGAAFCGLGFVLLVAGLGFLALDWTWSPAWPWRIAVWVGIAFVVVAAIRRDSWPLLKVREDLTDIALSVEAEHGIDNDLVAAMEFADDSRRHYGSKQLTNAVVEYVAESASGLDILQGFRWKLLAGRAIAAGLILLVWLGLAALFPTVITVFANRAMLGNARYPTATRIERVLVDGKIAWQRDGSATDSEQRLVHLVGQPAAITVIASGRLPFDGRLDVREATGSQHASLRLKTSGEPSAAADQFSLELPPVVQSLKVQAFLGDDWSEPFTIDAIARPAVQVELTPHLPAYATADIATAATSGQRMVTVLPGSRVDVAIKSAGKPLKTVTCQISGKEFSLKAADDTGLVWLLPGGSPLDAVVESLPLLFIINDCDGLSPADPVTAQIRLRTDHPPRVSAGAITLTVLPNANPVVTWGARDDFGIKAARLSVTVQNAAGETRTASQPLSLQLADSPKLVRGESPVEFGPLKLQPGDEVRVVVEADDQRGPLPPQTGRSEPLIFRVTDQNGILAALLETDQRSAKQLDAIIEYELGIGGER